MGNNQFGKDEESECKMKNDGKEISLHKKYEDDHDHKFYNIFSSH